MIMDGSPILKSSWLHSNNHPRNCHTNHDPPPIIPRNKRLKTKDMQRCIGPSVASSIAPTTEAMIHGMVEEEIVRNDKKLRHRWTHSHPCRVHSERKTETQW